MRKLLTVIGCALLVVAGPQRADAQDTKVAKGTITAVTASSLSIKVQDKVMTFTVDEKTDVIARGASTQTQAARAEGRKGAALPSLVKVGQGVEVRYQEAGMRAEDIRVLPGPVEGSVSEKQDRPERQTVNGTVSAVTGKSLTVKTRDGDVMFVIDRETDVIGQGIGTAAQKKKEAGEATVITDFVAVGDDVRVVYHAMGDMKHAAEVHVTRKGTIKR